MRASQRNCCEAVRKKMLKYFKNIVDKFSEVCIMRTSSLLRRRRYKKL